VKSPRRHRLTFHLNLLTWSWVISAKPTVDHSVKQDSRAPFLLGLVRFACLESKFIILQAVLLAPAALDLPKRSLQSREK